MVSKESAFQKISILVNRFEEQLSSYKNTEYNETLTRRDFIDPFFKALGWDMDNENGYAEAYREVIHEDKLKIGSATKAPDYSFRLPGGKRLFFVEAKKPSVFVKEEIPPAYQVRRYGWSAKMPVSIVTDFEEFSIYDCTKKPKATDKASTARIKYLTFKEYLGEFDFIWDTFSKEKVLKGSFDKFVLSDTGKKGTATVDKEFLESLNDWRKLLAETISINNKKLNEDQINFAVQQTLDRIIFLRISEDRSVEPYGKLKESLNKGDYYKNLFEYFEEADRKYNSGLFDFKKDTLSGSIKIENRILEKVINELYYPVSPYEFSVLSVEILGSAYEQFLGKVIRLTPSHKAKIEEKPEVRKAGGVYYTPQYIVDYIVKNTLGKMVEGKTPKEIEKIKIVDPACGSGSFLIGAYQYLLDWHLNYYTQGADPLVPDKSGTLPLRKGETNSLKQEGNSKVPSLARRGFRGGHNNFLTPDGRLTTEIKKKILLNNIYGVDIDTQAVEVTKLSLLLKCMEGETQASVQQTMSFMQERVLPTLDNNIKCGNSLIDTDFYDGELEFDGTNSKIKAFNWKSAFPEVFKQGGFDCVIGNPPYVLGRETFDDNIKRYISLKYKSYGGKYDLYIFFFERAMNLLKDDGFTGFIIPNTLLVNENAANLRKLLLEKYSINQVRLFTKKVFEKAHVETIILICSNTRKLNTIDVKDEFKTFQIKKDTFIKNKDYRFNVLNNDNSNSILDKLRLNNLILGDLIDICIGIQLGGSSKSKKEDFISEIQKGKEWKKVLDGKEINYYNLNWLKRYVHYGQWLHRKRNEKYFLNPKILIRQIGNTPIATYDDSNYYTLNTIYNLISIGNISLKFILAIINSNAGKWFWNKVNSDFKSLFPKIKKSQIESIPIPKIDFTKPAEKQKHDEMVKLVDTMLALHKELPKAKLPADKEEIQQRIDHTDRRIDKLVYELYGLTEEEIRVVEGK